MIAAHRRLDDARAIVIGAADHRETEMADMPAEGGHGIGRVVGTVVSTKKHREFEGAKLMLVQPLNMDDTPRGNALLAVDGVGAGVDEKVLVVLEGRAAGEALGRKGAPVDAAIIGIIDTVTIDERLTTDDQ